MPELDPSAILRKTDAGVLAIKSNDRSLAPRARTLLIMVDGVKTAARLAAVNVDIAQGMLLLSQLVESGFASVSGAQATDASSPSATSSPAPSATNPAEGKPASAPNSAPARDLKVSIRAATRFLEGLMGPGADTFNIQLERCKSDAEFEAKVQEITLLLARARSVKKAEEFNAAALGK